MAKNKKKLPFWQRVRFKYTLSFINENTLEEVFSLKLSKLTGAITLSIFILVLITLTSIVIITTPIRNYLPGYLPAEIRQGMIENVLKTDSLEQLIQLQASYIDNISSIMRGEVVIETTPEIDTIVQYADPDLDPSEATEAFMRNFEEEEKYNLTTITSSASLPNNLIFYRPIKGMVSDKFNAQTKHYGTDIATSPKESVLATMKGIIIFAGFEANAGYVIQIQHPNGFVSIYKHNALLLKAQGDEVTAGEAIALAGNTGNLSTGAHLHFELWYRGYPIDPEEFIVF